MKTGMVRRLLRFLPFFSPRHVSDNRPMRLSTACRLFLIFQIR